MSLLEKLGPYKPDVKSMTVDYLTRSTVMKLLLNVPAGIKRRVRDIEIPAYNGYSVYEVFDGESLNKLDLQWELKDGKWVTDAAKLPSAEKYFVTLRGAVTKDALSEIVGVFCPEEPKKEPEHDRYWIQSGIKDMSILENIYRELSIERVAVDVKVGIERPFSTSIPDKTRHLLEARGRAEDAMDSRDRERVFREWINYRAAKSEAKKFSPTTFTEIARRVVSPEIFILFLNVDEPFQLGGVVNIVQSNFIPEAVQVTVQANLNFKQPAAKGNLTFRKKEFSDRLSSEFKDMEE